MGLTFIDVIIANPGNPRKTRKLRLLVDSGAIYSVVPRHVLRQLGVKAHSSKTFTLADGSGINRKIGDAIFKLDGYQGASRSYSVKKGTARCLELYRLRLWVYFLIRFAVS